MTNSHPDTPLAMTPPSLFRLLIHLGCLAPEDILSTADHFQAVTKPLASIAAARGIHQLYNQDDHPRDCSRFFDDWYLYAAPGQQDYVYGLLKLREQESDSAGPMPADGDTPGVTVSFISLDETILIQCLENPTREHRKLLYREIDRVVAAPGQSHHNALKAYFVRPEADGPYLIARMYVRHIASFAGTGSVPVPEHYARLYQKRPDSRLPRFLNANNSAAGYPVCDHKSIFIRDPMSLTPQETLAILATHTANVSFHSFAAEICYHACFLTWYAKIPIPFLGRSPYASAIRADMSINDTEWEGPAPFHRSNSKWVRRQAELHRDF